MILLLLDIGVRNSLDHSYLSSLVFLYLVAWLNRPEYTLPPWVQRYIRSKPNNRSTTVAVDKSPKQTASIEYYKIPFEEIQIVFVDSMPGYERLLDRLFNGNNSQEELILGFD
ncbi:unnamed protein product, partial [Rotaria magnacalcarata]